MNTMLQHIPALNLNAHQQQKLSASSVGRELLSVFQKQSLTAVFQPIIDIKERCIFAHEALIRGPKNSFLHNPMNILQVAEEHDCLFEVDWLARLMSIHSFQQQKATSLLFLNVTVNTIMQKSHKSGITLEYLQLLGIPVEQVVIEITELQPVEDFRAFVESVDHYRKMGFKVAIDDLGAGYNGLRIWSEIRPDFVKIDHHFVTDIDNDSDKYHFMETICSLARKLGTRVVAEGVESYSELQALESLEVDYVQGYLFNRPHEIISQKLEFDWQGANGQTLNSRTINNCKNLHPDTYTAADVLQNTFTVDLQCNMMDVARFFLANPQLTFVPVIEDDIIYGMIWRDIIMSHIVKALEYQGNPSRTLNTVIDTEVITLPVETPIHDVASILSYNQTLKKEAFIITDKGRYKGCAELKDVLQLLVRQKPLILAAG